MGAMLAPGFHVGPGRAVNTPAYDQFTGRWSRLLAPLVVARLMFSLKTGFSMCPLARVRLRLP
jgi:hypothetical protein